MTITNTYRSAFYGLAVLAMVALLVAWPPSHVGFLLLALLSGCVCFGGGLFVVKKRIDLREKPWWLLVYILPGHSCSVAARPLRRGW